MPADPQPNVATGIPTRAEPGGSTALVGVLGNPVRHSLSPAMHNAALVVIGKIEHEQVAKIELIGNDGHGFSWPFMGVHFKRARERKVDSPWRNQYSRPGRSWRKDARRQ